jgi:RimJ/RimL family protein N-acetyltransferase
VDDVAPPDVDGILPGVDDIMTERLRLRGFRPGDAETLAAYRSDPAVARFQSWEAPFSADDAERTVREMAAGDPERPGWFQYAIELDGRHIGDVGVNLWDNRMQADIGFTVDPRYQGKGLGSEAVLGVLRRLFDEQRLERVSAECDARNTASAGLLHRVGFTREGLRPRYTWIKGEWTDDLLFGLLARDWRT